MHDVNSRREIAALYKNTTQICYSSCCALDVHKVQRHNANDNTVNNYSKLNNVLHLL